MKKTYFLKCLGLMALVGGMTPSVFADEDIFIPKADLTVDACNSPYGDVTGTLDVRDTASYYRLYGLEVTDGGQVGDVSADILAIHVNYGVVYGIYMEGTGSIDSVSGSISIMTNYGNSVGYLAGELEDAYAVGMMSAVTGDSTAFNVDWTQVDLNVTLAGYTDEYPYTGVARGIYLNAAGSSVATGEGEYIGGSIVVLNEDDSEGTSIGIEATNGTKVGDLACSSSISATTENGGESYGVLLSSASSIGQLAGEMVVSSKTGDSYGLYLSDASSAGQMSGSMVVSSTKGNSYGMYLTGSSSAGQLSGTVEVSSTTGNSYGLYLTGASLTGQLSGNVAVSATKGDSYGLYLTGSSSAGQLAGTVDVSVTQGNATALYLESSTVGALSGSLTAYSEKASAMGIWYNTGDALVFSGGSVSATTSAGWGTAIENTSRDIRLVSESGTATIQGNLNAGMQELRFESGQFALEGDTWSAASVSVGSDGASAQLTLGSSIVIDATELNFYINSLDDLSTISVAGGSSLNLESVNTINVYLDDGVMESGEFELTLMDGQLTGLAEDVSVNYILSDAYSADYLSAGMAEDATSFFVSQSYDAVPEPSTASLSLLALAALLSRRQRKRAA